MTMIIDNLTNFNLDQYLNILRHVI